MGEADDYTYCRLFQRIEKQHFPPTIVKYCCQYKNGFEIEKLALDAYYSILYGPNKSGKTHLGLVWKEMNNAIIYNNYKVIVYLVIIMIIIVFFYNDNNNK